MLLRRADPLLPFQALAVVPHPRLRLLLSDVGNHVPRPTTPFDRAEAVRPQGELRARVGEGITVLKSVQADAETRRRGDAEKAVDELQTVQALVVRHHSHCWRWGNTGFRFSRCEGFVGLWYIHGRCKLAAQSAFVRVHSGPSRHGITPFSDEKGGLFQIAHQNDS